MVTGSDRQPKLLLDTLGLLLHMCLSGHCWLNESYLVVLRKTEKGLFEMNSKVKPHRVRQMRSLTEGSGNPTWNRLI